MEDDDGLHVRWADNLLQDSRTTPLDTLIHDGEKSLIELDCLLIEVLVLLVSTCAAESLGRHHDGAGRGLGLTDQRRDPVIVEVFVLEKHFGDQVRVFYHPLELLIEEIFKDVTMLESPHEVGHVFEPIVEPEGVGIGIPDLGGRELIVAERRHDE